MNTRLRPTIKELLSILLEKDFIGVSVSPNDIVSCPIHQRGQGYPSWRAVGKIDGWDYHIISDSTMTECVKGGIAVYQKSPNSAEVLAIESRLTAAQ